jgi:class 3 adenylate cyclase
MTITPANPSPPLRADHQVDGPTAGPPAPIKHAKGELALVAVDIAAFGDPRRDNEIQLHLRSALYDHIIEAFAMTRLPWRGCYHEDRGDGALIVAPPEVEPTDLLDPLAHHLTVLLRRSNKLASDSARLRVRVAVHTGRVYADESGIAGQALVHLFRLNEAPAFKRALNASGADLGLMVSDHLYAEARAHGGFFDPDAYRPLTVRHKETRTRGWLWLPAGERRAL